MFPVSSAVSCGCCGRCIAWGNADEKGKEEEEEEGAPVQAAELVEWGMQQRWIHSSEMEVLFIEKADLGGDKAARYRFSGHVGGTPRL